MESFKYCALNSVEAEDAGVSCNLMEETVSLKKQMELIHEQHEMLKTQQGAEIFQESLKQQEDNFCNLKKEIEKLQKKFKESLDILGLEITEKNTRIRELEEYYSKPTNIRRGSVSKKSIKERISTPFDPIHRSVKNENFSSGHSLQEINSLRSVLELKQSECGELRKQLAVAKQKADLLPSAENKISFLMAKLEDMNMLIERKNTNELKLVIENNKLTASLKEEIKTKSRLLLQNEELEWKVRKNKEVVAKILEEASASSQLNGSILSASFHENKASFRKRSLSNTCGSYNSNKLLKSKTSYQLEIDESPTTSSVIKKLVEKTDSIGYVLEINESPEIIAARIIRRSLRSTPTKSPSNKRLQAKLL